MSDPYLPTWRMTRGGVRCTLTSKNGLISRFVMEPERDAMRFFSVFIEFLAQCSSACSSTDTTTRSEPLEAV